MQARLESVVREVEKAITGKQQVIERILMALLADGHVLLDDVPGVGKTTLAVAISRAVGMNFKRVQFTPDVLPSDLVGFSVYDQGSGSFTYRPGALSQANLLLGDCFGKPGIVADTHCIRLNGRFGFYPETLKDPLRVEKILSEIVPREDQAAYCHRMVLFGRDTCTARAPKCGECPLKPYCLRGSRN